VCSISGYGIAGPDEQRAGHDINYLARAGVLGMMKEPQLLPVQVADIMGGSFPAVIQILAALRRQDQQGKGSIIDVSMCDNSFSLLTMPYAKYTYAKTRIGQGEDLLVGGAASYGVYKTSDGHLSIGALEPKFWSGLVTAVGLPHLIDSGLGTFSNVQRARAELQQVLLQKTTAEWTEFFRKLDVCVEAVLKPENVLVVNPQLASRELTVGVNVGEETIQLVKTPIRMSDVQHSSLKGPLIGEHTQQILQLQSRL